MKENIKQLKELFNEIKEKEFNQTLRTGPTGIGYTFEKLIGKEEDRDFFPDFNGIEIKTKLGYSKSALTLFSIVPTKDDESAISYLLNTFGYPDKIPNFKNFRGDVFEKRNNIIANRYIFKTKIDEKNNKLILNIYDKNSNLINNSIYWSLKDIELRLLIKLQYLAFIKGYKYCVNNKIYYKYKQLTIYKLKDFKTFLKLLMEDKIYITFNIGMHKSDAYYGKIYDRGTAFRLKLDSIEELFDKVD